MSVRLEFDIKALAVYRFKFLVTSTVMSTISMNVIVQFKEDIKKSLR